MKFIRWLVLEGGQRCSGSNDDGCITIQSSAPILRRDVTSGDIMTDILPLKMAAVVRGRRSSVQGRVGSLPIWHVCGVAVRQRRLL